MKPKPISWLHFGDTEPTIYQSQADLARKFGVQRCVISSYVRRGIDGDEARVNAQKALRGCIIKSYVAKPVVYEGIEYPSIADFQRKNGLSRRKAIRMLGMKVPKSKTRNRMQKKLEMLQSLVLRARK